MNKTLFCFLISLFVTIVTSFDCRPGWIEYYDYCYNRLFVESSYVDALDFCAYHGSELLTINSKEEKEFVTKYLLENEISIWLDSVNSEFKDWKEDSDEKLTSLCTIVKRTAKHDSKWFRLDCLDASEIVCKERARNSPTTTSIPTTATVTFSPTLTPTVTTPSNTTTEISSTPTNNTSITPTTESNTASPTHPTSTPKPSSCGTWKRYKKKNYCVTKKPGTFEENQKVCKSLGATLTSVHSEDENKFIVSLYDKKEHDQGRFTSFYLGARAFKWNEFTWIDGSKLDYKHWGYKFPIGHPAFNAIMICVDHDQCWGGYSYWANKPDCIKAFGVCSYSL